MNRSTRLATGGVLIVLALIAAGLAAGISTRADAAPAPIAAPAPCKSIIHRAMHTDYDEEQPGGIRAAAKWGWGSELDLRVTLDEKVVLVHDPDLRRITGGVDTRKVADLTYAELRAVTLARGGHPIGIWAGVRAAKQSGGKLLLEIKDYPANKAAWDGGGLATVVNAITKQGMTGRVFLGKQPVAWRAALAIDSDLRGYRVVFPAATDPSSVEGVRVVQVAGAALNEPNITALRQAGHLVYSANVTLTNNRSSIVSAYYDGIRVFFTNKGWRVAQGCKAATA